METPFEQFKRFMCNDFKQQDSGLCKFLCKRAQFMISYNFKNLGDYLRILSQFTEENEFNLEGFIEEMANNFEEFKNSEAMIKRKYFDMDEESEILSDSVKDHKIFDMPAMSQLSAVDPNNQGSKDLLGRSQVRELNYRGRRADHRAKQGQVRFI
jgi:hypothetical protein